MKSNEERLSGADITVVIPAHNCAPFIEPTLSSVANQTVKPAEIIVVVNASIDATYDAASRFASNSEIPIRIIRTDCPGVSNARNIGFSLARTHLIAMLDADDLYSSDFLEIAIRAFNKNSDLVFFFGNRRNYVDNRIAGKPFLESTLLASLPHKEIDTDIRLIDGNLFSALAYGSFVSCSGTVLRKQFAFQAGLFPLHLKSGEDQYFFCRLSLLGPAAYTLKMAHLYRIHGASCTSSNTHLIHRKSSLVALLTLGLSLHEATDSETLNALKKAIKDTSLEITYLTADKGALEYINTMKWLRRTGCVIPTNPFYLLKALKNSLQNVIIRALRKKI